MNKSIAHSVFVGVFGGLVFRWRHSRAGARSHNVWWHPERTLLIVPMLRRGNAGVTLQRHRLWEESRRRWSVFTSIPTLERL